MVIVRSSWHTLKLCSYYEAFLERGVGGREKTAGFRISVARTRSRCVADGRVAVTELAPVQHGLVQHRRVSEGAERCGAAWAYCMDLGLLLCWCPFLQSGTLVIALVIATGELGRNAFLWLLSWALVALGLGSGNHGFRYSSRVSVVPTLWKRWTFGTLVCLQRLRPHQT